MPNPPDKPIATAAVKATVSGPFFAPGEDPENAMVAFFNRQTKTIYTQYYGYDSKPVSDAIKAAHARGVAVQCLFDKSNVDQSYSLVPELLAAGIPVLVDYLPPIAHSKVAIGDEREVMEGSYNPTNQARENAENAVVIASKVIAARYLANWQRRRALCETWTIAEQKLADKKKADQNREPNK
jgi:phosphatidylserine/phosphatidylglycerophosphate/cardiolipin synthase-like enzyme